MNRSWKMEKKKIINGDVGQIVHGNSTPHTTTQHNSHVVNVTIGDKEHLYLTKFQREKITKQVKEYSALAGLDRLEIYKDLLIIGGAKKMDLFPLDKYKEAAEWLDRMIATARLEMERKLKPELIAEMQTSDPMNSSIPSRLASDPKACSRCLELDSALKHARIKTTIFVALLSVSVVLQTWVYFGRSGAEVGSSGIEKKCMNDGKNYSVGSALKMSDGVLKQCVGYSNVDSAWEPIVKVKH